MNKISFKRLDHGHLLMAAALFFFGSAVIVQMLTAESIHHKENPYEWIVVVLLVLSGLCMAAKLCVRAHKQSKELDSTASSTLNFMTYSSGDGDHPILDKAMKEISETTTPPK